jgi:hypothetical protein
MDSGVAPHLRGAGPIFSVQSPGTPSMWSVGAFGLRPKPLRPGVLCPSKPRELALACALFYFW